MGVDELAALLEGDGEEVAFDFGSQRISQVVSGPFDEGANEGDAMEDQDYGQNGSHSIDDMELDATQADDGAKVFTFVNMIVALSDVFSDIQTPFRRLRYR